MACVDGGEHDYIELAKSPTRTRSRCQRCGDKQDIRTDPPPKEKPEPKETEAVEPTPERRRDPDAPGSQRARAEAAAKGAESEAPEAA